MWPVLSLQGHGCVGMQRARSNRGRKPESLPTRACDMLRIAIRLCTSDAATQRMVQHLRHALCHSRMNAGQLQDKPSLNEVQDCLFAQLSSAVVEARAARSCSSPVEAWRRWLAMRLLQRRLCCSSTLCLRRGCKGARHSHSSAFGRQAWSARPKVCGFHSPPAMRPAQLQARVQPTGAVRPNWWSAAPSRHAAATNSTLASSRAAVICHNRAASRSAHRRHHNYVLNVIYSVGNCFCVMALSGM
jgi:hypothetical protein